MAVDAKGLTVNAVFRREGCVPGDGLPVGCQRVVLVFIRPFRIAVKIPAAQQHIHCPGNTLRANNVTVFSRAIYRNWQFAVSEQTRRRTVDFNHTHTGRVFTKRAKRNNTSRCSRILLSPERLPAVVKAGVLNQIVAHVNQRTDAVFQTGY